MLGHFSLKQLQAMPTRNESHTDDLKYEDQGNTRVWLSRLSVSDGVEYDNQVTVEHYLNNTWVGIDVYQATDYTDFSDDHPLLKGFLNIEDFKHLVHDKDVLEDLKTEFLFQVLTDEVEYCLDTNYTSNESWKDTNGNLSRADALVEAINHVKGMTLEQLFFHYGYDRCPKVINKYKDLIYSTK